MDFLATILTAVAAIVEEYRQEHWRLQPPENDPLVMLATARQRANVANFNRGTSIFREALDVYCHLCQIVALRVNVAAFAEIYPAATRLRTKLGYGIWAALEHYRGAGTYLAFSTLREKRTAGNDLPTELKAFLNENTRHMETYIRARYGERAFLTFRNIQDSQVESIERERRQERLQEIQVQHGWPTEFLMRKFRREPIFWLMYNLNFPVEERMSWDQASMWAIQNLSMGGDIEPPTWPIGLRGLDGWDQDATEMWNEAVIEVFTDIRQRFCAIQSLHLAVWSI